MSDRIRLSVDEARTLSEHALAGLGYEAEEARIIADHVIDAALCGYEYSGLAKILNIPSTGVSGSRAGRSEWCARAPSRPSTMAATMSACWSCITPPGRRSRRRRRAALRCSPSPTAG